MSFFDTDITKIADICYKLAVKNGYKKTYYDFHKIKHSLVMPKENEEENNIRLLSQGANGIGVSTETGLSDEELDAYCKLPEILRAELYVATKELDNKGFNFINDEFQTLNTIALNGLKSVNGGVSAVSVGESTDIGYAAGLFTRLFSEDKYHHQSLTKKSIRYCKVLNDVEKLAGYSIKVIHFNLFADIEIALSYLNTNLEKPGDFDCLYYYYRDLLKTKNDEKNVKIAYICYRLAVVKNGYNGSFDDFLKKIDVNCNEEVRLLSRSVKQLSTEALKYAPAIESSISNVMPDYALKTYYNIPVLTRMRLLFVIRLYDKDKDKGVIQSNRNWSDFSSHLRSEDISKIFTVGSTNEMRAFDDSVYSFKEAINDIIIQAYDDIKKQNGSGDIPEEMRQNAIRGIPVKMLPLFNDIELALLYTNKDYKNKDDILSWCFEIFSKRY